MRLDLAHIAGSTFNTPLLMHRRRLDTVLSTLGPRILEGARTGGPFDADKFAAAMTNPQAASGVPVRRYAGGGYLTDLGVGVFPIVGTLLRRGTWLDAECGLMSYGLIRQGYDEMLADPSVHGLLIEYDTPGGEAGGVFDLARHMRAAAKEAGKPLWAHANELAASAGFALASAADRIWIATTGEVGSIGVVAAHVDISNADEKAGLKWTYIYEGDRKVDGNPHEPLSAEADKAIRADVRDLYDQFVDLVAANRGVTAQRIRETQAETFRGKLAVDRKLADEVGSLEDAVAALAEKVSGSTTGAPVAKRLARPIATPRTQAIAAAAAAEVDRVRADASEILQIAAMAKRTFGLDVDAGLAINRRVSPQAFRTQIINAAADRDAASETTTAASAPKTGEAKREDAVALWKKGHAQTSTARRTRL